VACDGGIGRLVALVAAEIAAVAGRLLVPALTTPVHTPRCCGGGALLLASLPLRRSSSSAQRTVLSRMRRGACLRVISEALPAGAAYAAWAGPIAATRASVASCVTNGRLVLYALGRAVVCR
jgi:hypothetical protein